MIGSALTLAAVAWAGASRAQQPKVAGRDEQRGRLITLRAEVDLLRVEHEAARAHLRDVLVRADRLEFLERTDSVTPVGLLSYHQWAINGNEAKAEKFLEAAGFAGIVGGDKDSNKEANDAIAKDLENLAKGLRAAVDRTKEDYLARSAALEEKSLELAGLEERSRNPK